MEKPIPCTFQDCATTRIFYRNKPVVLSVTPYNLIRSINRLMQIQDQIDSKKRNGEIEFYIEERSEECVKSRMPVSKGVLNPYGVIQAGAMLWLADVTASVLAIGNSKITDSGKGFPLAVNLHSSFLGNQRDGDIFAEARFVRKGRSIIVVRTRITGSNNKLLAEITTTHVPVK